MNFVTLISYILTNRVEDPPFGFCSQDSPIRVYMTASELNVNLDFTYFVHLVIFFQSLCYLHDVRSLFFLILIRSAERNLIVLLNKLMPCAKGGLSSISFKVKMTIQS